MKFFSFSRLRLRNLRKPNPIPNFPTHPNLKQHHAIPGESKPEEPEDDDDDDEGLYFLIELRSCLTYLRAIYVGELQEKGRTDEIAPQKVTFRLS